MLSRLFIKSWERLFLFVVVLFLTASVIYLYAFNLQEHQNVKSSVHRCFSELTSLKYQLNEVTAYKDRIDKLLTVTQKAHEADKEKFKDIMDSCADMKQQASICQNQFEDLQSECKKVRDDYNQLKKRQSEKKV